MNENLSAPREWGIRSPRVSSATLFVRALVVCGALVTGSIVPIDSVASDALRHNDAVAVYNCDFQERWDLNYDGWPDRWVRKSGARFPHYVDIRIQDDTTAPSGRCLRVELDGASAEVTSPPILVTPLFSYVLEARLKAENLEYGNAVITLDLCDKSGKLLQTAQCEPVSATDGWQQIRLAVGPNNPRIDRAIVGLRVLRDEKPDLQARVSLGDVWLARHPRIKVTTNSPSHVYQKSDEVVVKCELSGIPEQHPEIRFELRDTSNRTLEEATFELAGQLIVEAAESEIRDGAGITPNGYEGTSEWRPKLPGHGLFCVVVKMLASTSSPNRSSEERVLDSHTIWIAVLPPLEMPLQGDFGWTLSAQDRPLGFSNMARLLPQAGVSWVKVPLWFDANDNERGNELIRFVELLGASNVEVVGVIDRPPPGVTVDGLAMRPNQYPAVADLFALDPSFWSPALDPVMTRLALRVRWWQLGRDHDTSFMGFPGLDGRIRELRARLFRFGQEVKLGLAWDWDNQHQVPGAVAWDFQQFSTESPPSDATFLKYLAEPRLNTAARWVLVEPPRSGSAAAELTAAAREARASEFVHRLVAAKEYGADGVFIADPFNDETGVMRADGTPGELLLPWRTTSAMLGGSKYLGRMDMPAGSENRIFLRPDGRVVMVVWNRQPSEEQLFLGESVRQLDLWGTEIGTRSAGDEQTIQVGPVPSFVLGLHEGVTRWRMGLAFESNEVPSVFSVPHANLLKFKNFFPQGVGGTFSIAIPPGPGRELSDSGSGSSSGFVPDRWVIEPPRGSFRLAEGESAEFPFEIRLKNALYGRQALRIDFTVDADQPYRFSVYREMEVGTSDLTLGVKTHIDEDGVLVVEQLMSNKAERLADFKCNLYAKGRRRQRVQVFRLGSSIDRKLYRFENGEDLVGNDMLLEIEELNGRRVIKYRFTATEKAQETDDDKKDDASVNDESDESHDAPDRREVDVDDEVAAT